MGKKIKHDFNKWKSNKIDNFDDGSKIISIDELKKRFAGKLLTSLAGAGYAWKTSVQHFAAVTHDVLKDEFDATCDIKLKETPNGYFKICLTRKGAEKKAVSQAEITITKDFMYNIHLNDYEKYEEFYYHGSKLSSMEIMGEVKSMGAFLHGQSMSENTKFTKEVYRQAA